MKKTANPDRPTTPAARRRRHAFTLIELMISIAMVIVLMIGINKVFQYTSKAVGQGQAINSAVRDSRAAQSVMAQDFADLVPNGTASTDAGSIIIQSSAQPAFRDRADEAGDRGVGSLGPQYPNYPRELTIDVNGDGIEGDPNVPGEIVKYAEYNFRNHRIDTLSFFARDKFPRQTGNLGTYAADQTSQEAWIWYGHLSLPNNSGAFPYDPVGKHYLTYPGDGGSAAVNPNNYYASQFTLGRVAMLLLDKTADTAFGVINDNNGFQQRFFNRTNPYVPTNPTELEPLSATSPTKSVAGDSTGYAFESSRFDLAATTIAKFRDKLAAYLVTSPPNPAALSNPPWYDLMMSGRQNKNIFPSMPSNPTNGGAPYATRFEGNPFLSKPIDSVQMAQASPIFLQGCSQFIVEFAGDYLTQDNDPSSATYGKVLDPTPKPPGTGDGVIDYCLIRSEPTVPNSPIVKQTIWYGFPRQTTPGVTLRGPGNSLGNTLAKGDVVPVRDWLQANGMPTTLAFEHLVNFPASAPQTAAASYLNAPNVAGGLPAGAQNACAFGPNDSAPKLIRITITVTDAGGQLPDGQTYQYVFPVAAP